jgi:hypothetical protein
MQTDPVKQKIHELCPDVLELKFGCLLLGEDGTTLHFDPYIVTYSVDPLPHVLARTENEFINFQTKEVLGSPITLAVVLRAILKTNPANRTKVTLESSGQFVETLYNGSFSEKQLGPTWNLSADNYDQQSEECKRFIGSLLTNEK